MVVLRRGLDYSWGRPPPAAMLAAGFDFACRYVSLDTRAMGSGTTKLIDRAEALAMGAAGMDLVLVWEGRAADRDPLQGAGKGAADATEALRQAGRVGEPGGCGIFFAVDWDVAAADLPKLDAYFRAANVVTGPDRVGAYGSFRVVRYLFDRGLITYGWQTYAWSGGAWDARAQVRQTVNAQSIAGHAVDFNEAHQPDFGQWRPTVTTAPADILAIQRYCRERTGLPWESLGIVGDAKHIGGYHHGASNLSPTDYSVRESVRDSRPTSAASGFDLGDFSVMVNGRRVTHLDVIRAVLAAWDRGDPRVRDIREMIYSLDDAAVRRRDRLGIRSSGDTSHFTHTHFSFHRDSEGRRHLDDNFLGLLKATFDGVPAPPAPPAPSPTAKGIKMLVIARRLSDRMLFLCDGMTARPINDAERGDISYLAAAGAIGPLWKGGEIWDGMAPGFGTIVQPATPPTSFTEAQIQTLAAALAAAGNELSEADRATILRLVTQGAKTAAREGAGEAGAT
jgi:hypothetical protein